MGLRYTNVHFMALCSPTRSALITGRMHHSTGFGVISEQATGYPGYDSVITKDKATVGTILKDNGYNTSWFGKNHNTPGHHISMAGPFDDGRQAWASTIFLASWAATRANGRWATCSATPPRSTRLKRRRATT